MLTFEPGRAANDPAFQQALGCLKALVADLEAVQSGRTATVLPPAAPHLEQWHIAQRAAVCLIGRSSGHPLLPGADRQVATSDLWLLSTDRRWARTLSRWYRLGEPHGRGEDPPRWH